MKTKLLIAVLAVLSVASLSGCATDQEVCQGQYGFAYGSRELANCLQVQSDQRRQAIAAFAQLYAAQHHAGYQAPIRTNCLRFGNYTSCTTQ
jgi:hypothetical protein